MARKIVHQLVDDIDDSVLEIGEGETVHFSLDGAAYEIDLTSEHAAELREALSVYIAAGRRARVGGGARPTSAVKRPNRNPETATIRAWAGNNGFTLSDRGRIPAEVVTAYRAAH